MPPDRRGSLGVVQDTRTPSWLPTLPWGPEVPPRAAYCRFLVGPHSLSRQARADSCRAEAIGWAQNRGRGADPALNQTWDCSIWGN